MPDPLDTIQNLIEGILNPRIGLFAGIGVRMTRSFSAILIVWLGTQMALSGRGLDLARFARLLMLIAFVLTMVTYYNGGIPGIGYSFVDLFREQGRYLSQELGQDAMLRVNERLAEAGLEFQTPATMNLYIIGMSIVITLILAFMKGVMFMVIGYGMIGQAVCFLLGPLFLPFFLVPKLEFLAMSWIRATLVFTFIRVVANAFLLVFGEFLLGTLLIDPPPEMALHDYMIALLPATLPMFLIFAYAVLKIPTMTSELFSGSVGGDSGVGRAVSSVMGLR